MRIAVSLGGDSDTLACITGGIAEAYYGEIPDSIVDVAMSILPEEFKSLLDRFNEGSFYKEQTAKSKPYATRLIQSRRRTPPHMTSLKPNEVFVFGSNLQGWHDGGAAAAAMRYFGAVWGQGVGMQGQCYAIPTMHGGVDVIKPYVDQFVAYARDHQDMIFYVTRIGCGIAGFTDRDIAPLFKDALDLPNVALPVDFIGELLGGYNMLHEDQPLWVVDWLLSR